MTLKEQLRLATIQAQNESDLPDFLAERIFSLMAELREGVLTDSDILDFIEQVSLYDAYAQTGYIGMGVDDKILAGSLRRLEEKITQNNLTKRKKQ